MMCVASHSYIGYLDKTSPPDSQHLYSRAIAVTPNGYYPAGGGYHGDKSSRKPGSKEEDSKRGRSVDDPKRGGILDVSLVSKHFMRAVKTANISDLETLLAFDPKMVNRRVDSEGSLPLYWAACAGKLSVCRLLLERGARVDLVNSTTGSNPLHAAADRGHADIAEMLIYQGIDLNKRTYNNFDTALHFAAYRGHVSICDLLLRHGADWSIINKQGRTPSDEAKALKHYKIVELFKLKMAETRFYQKDTIAASLISDYAAVLKPNDARAEFDSRRGQTNQRRTLSTRPASVASFRINEQPHRLTAQPIEEDDCRYGNHFEMAVPADCFRNKGGSDPSYAAGNWSSRGVRLDEAVDLNLRMLCGESIGGLSPASRQDTHRRVGRENERNYFDGKRESDAEKFASNAYRAEKVSPSVGTMNKSDKNVDKKSFFDWLSSKDVWTEGHAASNTSLNESIIPPSNAPVRLPLNASLRNTAQEVTTGMGAVVDRPTTVPQPVHENTEPSSPFDCNCRVVLAILARQNKIPIAIQRIFLDQVRNCTHASRQNQQMTGRRHGHESESQHLNSCRHGD